MSVNLTSAFLMAKYSVPYIKKQGGAILNIASVSGLANQEEAMVYSVTKAGLLSLTRSEAIDLAKIRHPCQRYLARIGGDAITRGSS